MEVRIPYAEYVPIAGKLAQGGMELRNCRTVIVIFTIGLSEILFHVRLRLNFRIFQLSIVFDTIAICMYAVNPIRLRALPRSLCDWRNEVVHLLQIADLDMAKVQNGRHDLGRIFAQSVVHQLYDLPRPHDRVRILPIRFVVRDSIV